MEAISSEKTASDFVRSGNRTTFSHSERVIRRHSVAARPVADTCRKSCSTVKHRKPLPTVRTPSRCALFPITPLNIDSPIGRVKPRKMLNISSSCRAIASFRIQLAYLSDDKVSGRMGSGYMSDCERARYRAIPRSLSLYPAFRKQPTMRFVIPFGEPPRATCPDLFLQPDLLFEVLSDAVFHRMAVVVGYVAGPVVVGPVAGPLRLNSATCRSYVSSSGASFSSGM